MQLALCKSVRRLGFLPRFYALMVFLVDVSLEKAFEGRIGSFQVEYFYKIKNPQKDFSQRVCTI